jgi:hypothetical protein
LLFHGTVNFFNYKLGAFRGQINGNIPLVSLAIFADAVVHTDAEKTPFRDLSHVQIEFQNADLDQMSDDD